MEDTSLGNSLTAFEVPAFGPRISVAIRPNHALKSTQSFLYQDLGRPAHRACVARKTGQPVYLVRGGDDLPWCPSDCSGFQRSGNGGGRLAANLSLVLRRSVRRRKIHG